MDVRMYGGLKYIPHVDYRRRGIKMLEHSNYTAHLKVEETLHFNIIQDIIHIEITLQRLVLISFFLFRLYDYTQREIVKWQVKE